MKYRIDVKGGLAPRFVSIRVLSVLFSSILGIQSATTPPPAGVAPVMPPTGGLAIDGNLMANASVADVGDWLAGAGGSGQGVLDTNGTPINPITTFHLIDPFNNAGADVIFAGGLKWFEDPNNWRYSSGKSSAKTDINNVLLHIAPDVDGHIWASVAADRVSTSGDSYIDFEFLQNTLAKGDDDYFVSEGPHGGRTVNDLLLSLAFTGGGKVADFFVWSWQPNGAGGYSYVDITASIMPGHIFAALNETATSVPYGALGGFTYSRYAFAEGTVDLTHLLSSFDPCLSLTVRTIMVKTKSSASDTASIADLIDPIQVSLTFGPGSNAGPDQTLCSQGDSTTFALEGIATRGLYPILSNAWTVVEGEVTLDDPAALETAAHVRSASALVRLSVYQEGDCVVSDDVRLNVTPLPVPVITGPIETPACPNAEIILTGPAGMDAYAWSVSGNATITGAADQAAVTIRTGDLCGESFSVSLTVTKNNCSDAASVELLVSDTTAPLLALPADIELPCPAQTGPAQTGVATASDDCGFVTVDFADDVTALCGNTRVIRRTWTATDSCGNQTSAVQTISVVDRAAPSLTIPSDATLACPLSPTIERTGMASASDECGSVRVDYSDETTEECGGTKTILRTWTAVDDCGNITVKVQTIRVVDTTAPNLVIPADATIECPLMPTTDRTGLATASDECGAASVEFSDNLTGECGGTRTILRTWTATDECGNVTSKVQTIRVIDTVAPSLTIPEDVTLECPADTSTGHTGIASAADECGSALVDYSDETTEECGGTKTILRTWTATDDCGNTTVKVQTIRVVDTTGPSLTIPPDRTLECPAIVTTNVTGSASALDACGSVMLDYSDAVTDTCGNTRTIRRTWTAIDDCGNTTVKVQTIRVVDTTAPALVIPDDVRLECPADTNPSSTGTATASEDCSQATVTYRDAISHLCGETRVIARTWTATDDCGNTVSKVQTIVVEDTTPPLITGPADLTLECPANTQPSATGQATGLDACGSVTISYKDQVTPICGGSKTIARTWTATDECGNKSSVLQTIHVVDTTPPVMSCPVAWTFSQGGYSGGGTPAEILAANFVQVFSGGLVLGIYDPSNGNTAPNGFLWEGTQAGLSALQDFYDQGTGSDQAFGYDAINPTDGGKKGGLSIQSLTLTLNVRFNQAGVLGVGPNNFGSVIYTSAGDSLSGKTVSEILEAANRALAGLGLPEGHNFSSLTALIDRLNMSYHAGDTSAWAEQHLEKPSVVVTCAGDVPAPDPSRVKANDACGGNVAIVHLGDFIVEQRCANQFVAIRSWMATDECGNSATCEQQIIVSDTIAPIVQGETERMVPGDQPWEFLEPVVSDNCGQDWSLAIVSTVTNVFAENALVATRTWLVSDACGNTNLFAQTVTVGNAMAIQSTFDTDSEDWMLLNLVQEEPPVHMSTGGQDGGYVSTATGGGSTGWFWTAPPEYLGDKSDYYGGVLTFAIMQSEPIASGQMYYVVLTGGGQSVILELEPPLTTDWTTYTLVLDETGGWMGGSMWDSVSQEDFINILSDLTEILIQADYGTSGATGGLDNVALVPPSSLSEHQWRLYIQWLGQNQVRVYWSALATGYLLEASPSLSQPQWTLVPVSPVEVDGMNQVILPTGSVPQFYRLRKPAP